MLADQMVEVLERLLRKAEALGIARRQRVIGHRGLLPRISCTSRVIASAAKQSRADEARPDEIASSLRSSQ